MTPHVERRDQAQPEPSPVAEDSVAPNAPVPVADGYAPNGWRWWVTRQADVLHPIVTVQGWNGPCWVNESREMEGANRRRVLAWVEQIAAQVAAAAARKGAPSRRKAGG